MSFWVEMGTRPRNLNPGLFDAAGSSSRLTRRFWIRDRKYSKLNPGTRSSTRDPVQNPKFSNSQRRPSPELETPVDSSRPKHGLILIPAPETSLNLYRRGLETCSQVKMFKSERSATIFSSLFSDASERRVWLSAESKILAFTFEPFRLNRLRHFDI